ncbi:hypothetical protein CONLIGDRAFT_685911 [Coniochaeta ligniaria NRRL 30616]|uniref:Uncharacterized protein n=1 Tax=Coniochaeta ligniaria NRRL 30616 TaxID=1408157 RepID=A0A1J7IAF6_9PEZI|nr:hypothetical protein CONLIGDRAFT_685911 [Coniochaeta ligniaria NRRL 30616]
MAATSISQRRRNFHNKHRHKACYSVGSREAVPKERSLGASMVNWASRLKELLNSDPELSKFMTKVEKDKEDDQDPDTALWRAMTSFLNSNVSAAHVAILKTQRISNNDYAFRASEEATLPQPQRFRGIWVTVASVVSVTVSSTVNRESRTTTTHSKPRRKQPFLNRNVSVASE